MNLSGHRRQNFYSLVDILINVDVFSVLTPKEWITIGMMSQESLTRLAEDEMLDYILKWSIFSESSCNSQNFLINLVKRMGTPICYLPQQKLKKNTMEMYLRSENFRLYSITMYYNCLPQLNSSTNSFVRHSKQLLSSDFNEVIRSYDCIPPFSTSMKDSAGPRTVRLSCIAYFEVHFTRVSASNAYSNNSSEDGLSNSNEIIEECYFGLASSYQEIEKSLSGKEEYSFVYSSSGRIMYNKRPFAYDNYYKFNPGDILGCGICYPPLVTNNGQIFFTRNGEVIHIEQFSSPDYLSISWFPFAVSECIEYLKLFQTVTFFSRFVALVL
jgi:hypothetical protein